MSVVVVIIIIIIITIVNQQSLILITINSLSLPPSLCTARPPSLALSIRFSLPKSLC